MIRLFIAVPLSQPLKRALAAMIEQFQQPDQSIKWVRPENCHLTLKFLGETNERCVPELKNALDRTLSRHQPFNISFDRLGGFPNLSRPKIIYLGMNDQPDALEALARAVEKACLAIGLAEEKKRFRPHLTLGRVKGNDRLEPLLKRVTTYEFEPVAQRLDRIELIQSTLTPAGPIYRTLHQTEFAERFE